MYARDRHSISGKEIRGISSTYKISRTRSWQLEERRNEWCEWCNDADLKPIVSWRMIAWRQHITLSAAVTAPSRPRHRSLFAAVVAKLDYAPIQKWRFTSTICIGGLVADITLFDGVLCYFNLLQLENETIIKRSSFRLLLREKFTHNLKALRKFTPQSLKEIPAFGRN